MASLVLRENIWHVAWRHRGKQKSRSTKCVHDGKTNKDGTPKPTAAALRELRKLENELDRGQSLSAITLDQLLKLTEKEYEVAGYKSAKSLPSRLEHIRGFFGNAQARALSETDLLEYADHRKKQGAAAATINREMEVIGKALHIGARSGKVETWIRVRKLKEPPARSGFFDDAKIAAVIRHLPEYLRAPVMFGYLTGWRRSEIFGLQWKDIDFAAGEIRLATSKNEEPRVFPMTEALRSLLESLTTAQQAVESGTPSVVVSMKAEGMPALTPFVFVHTRSKRYGGKSLKIADFRKAWRTACVNAGCPGMVYHDLRRSAARRLEMEGNRRSVIMEVMGHKSESMFHRYRIVGKDDLVITGNDAVVKALEAPKAGRGKLLKKKAVSG